VLLDIVLDAVLILILVLIFYFIILDASIAMLLVSLLFVANV
jgi:hypothetical protein